MTNDEWADFYKRFSKQNNAEHCRERIVSWTLSLMTEHRFAPDACRMRIALWARLLELKEREEAERE